MKTGTFRHTYPPVFYYRMRWMLAVCVNRTEAYWTIERVEKNTQTYQESIVTVDSSQRKTDLSVLSNFPYFLVSLRHRLCLFVSHSQSLLIAIATLDVSVPFQISLSFLSALVTSILIFESMWLTFLCHSHFVTICGMFQFFVTTVCICIPLHLLFFLKKKSHMEEVV